MSSWTAVLDGDSPIDPRGRYRDTVTFRAASEAAARQEVADVMLDGERLLYLGPGDAGLWVGDPRG